MASSIHIESFLYSRMLGIVEYAASGIKFGRDLILNKRKTVREQRRWFRTDTCSPCSK